MKKISKQKLLSKIIMLALVMTMLLAIFCTACLLGSPTKAVGNSFVTTTKTATNTHSQSFYSSAEEIVGLSKFDPREELTPVKDQGGTNLCWAYSATQASEASILKSRLANKDSLRLNPQALAYRKYVRNADPVGNNASYVSKYAGEWTEKAGQIAHTSALLACGKVQLVATSLPQMYGKIRSIA